MNAASFMSLVVDQVMMRSASVYD